MENLVTIVVLAGVCDGYYMVGQRDDVPVHPHMFVATGLSFYDAHADR